MRIDFHTHSTISHDALSEYSQILKECIKKNINAIAMTEHDKIDLKMPYNIFKSNNIDIIQGCEYTADNGSHIIGLFIKKEIKKFSSVDTIINEIKKNNGIVMIPHPFKEKTGFIKCTKNYKKYLEYVDIIELYNGGVKEKENEILHIKKLSKYYNLKLVAGSDSHKPDQIGYYLNKYTENKKIDLKNIILSEDPKIFINKSYKDKPRTLNFIQRNLIYQKIVLKINSELKMEIKRLIFKIFGNQNKTNKDIYREIK